MNAREVIADELRRLGSFMPDEETDNILFRLNIRGFTITSKEDVEAVRDKALEEACGAVGDPIKWHRALKSAGVRKNADLAHFTAGTAAAAIRSLKSIPHKE